MRALLLLAVLCLAVPLVAAAPAGPAGDRVVARAYDAQGRLVWERGISGDDDAIAFERFHHQADAAKPDNPGGGNGNGGGGGGSGGDGGSDPDTDCESDAYRAAPWRWSAPYHMAVDGRYGGADWTASFAAGAQAWEDAAGADLLGSVSFDGTAVAGVFDGVNKVGFADLGASTTIAVTTTWYNRFSGEAVESDGQYNTYFAWAIDGRAGAMDVQDIATHEVGHTFGLDHPSGPSHKIGCLTMYAYAGKGETQKRSLGDGDILGIRSLYGA